MDERKGFIAEWLTREDTMTTLCRRYGISRKTGYQVLGRYRAGGEAALVERSRAPRRQAGALAPDVEAALLRLRERHPRWGPRKLRAWLGRQQPGRRWPAASTIGALLKRHGVTIPRRRRARSTPPPTPLEAALAPNDVWTADFKGWFRTGDGRRCTPLTVVDQASRFLLRCQAVAAGDERHVRPLLEATFREYGLPRALRTDNGPPFASTAAGGLSRLAVWWIKLGIRPERIAPGHPEQNGRHERFHLTLQQDTAQPPRATGRAQQRAFDAFRQLFNTERPHEALGQWPPATVYVPSPRPYPERVPGITYDDGECDVRRVRHTGEIRWAGRTVFVSQALAREWVGLQELFDDCWAVRFGPVHLGWLDTRRPRSRHAPTTLKLLPMCPV